MQKRSFFLSLGLMLVLASPGVPVRGAGAAFAGGTSRNLAAGRGEDTLPQLREFDWMVAKVTANYSGYSDKVRDREAFLRFTDSLRGAAGRAGSLDEAVPLFESWLARFKDSHLSIRLKRSPAAGKTPAVDSLRLRFAFRPLNVRTALLVVPSFNIRYKQAVDSLLRANDRAIRSTPNLVVDIRGNGGGSDESYGGLIPFLYTNPIIRINSDIWSTADNIGKYESVAADTHYSRETRQAMDALVGRLRANIGRFVRQDDDDTLRLPAAATLPSRVIILVNGRVASSAEGFLLRAVQSTKVVLAGEHSKGELDYANVHYLDSPDGRMTLGCPTSRSRRLPGSPIDNVGIPPDVPLKPGADWIEDVARRADDFEFSPARFTRGRLSPAAGLLLPRKGENDTSAIDLCALAGPIVSPESRSTVERVRQVVQWTNANFEWTSTDYKNRTLKEIIVRGGGNCSEQTRVTRALLSCLGIRTRSMFEVNIQPDDEGRQARAAAKVREAGNKLSVFGLNHNDHVWIEFYDEASGRWMPADPTLGLVGIESWLVARVGFAPRPTHAIIPSRDMIVPIGIFARDERTGAIVEDRSAYYLVDQFNLAYGRRLEKTKEWAEWTRLLKMISPRCREAFEGKSNLHEYNGLIGQVRTVYEAMKSEVEH